jgi:hypothetical protein
LHAEKAKVLHSISSDPTQHHAEVAEVHRLWLLITEEFLHQKQAGKELFLEVALPDPGQR